MDISGPVSGSARLPALSTAMAAAWRPGQILSAVVAESGAGQLRLMIGNRQVSAQTSLELPKGERLLLEVIRNGDKPLLRVLSSAADQTLARQIRELLPRQGALTPLLSAANNLTRFPDARLPAPLAQLLRELIRQLPDSDSATTARGLRRALSRSGQFLEQQLAMQARDARATLSSDFKANLLRLADFLRNHPAPDGHTPASRAGERATSTPAPANPGKPAPQTAADRPAQTPDPKTAATTQRPDPASLARAVRSGLIPPPAANPRPATPMANPGSASRLTSDDSSAIPPPPARGSAPLAQPRGTANTQTLLRLANLQSELLRFTEAALARLQLQQLATAPRDGERGILEWLFELPLRNAEDIDLWSIRIARDRGNQQQDRPQDAEWSVQLAFDLPGLGAMHAYLRLHGEQISARLWAAQASTLQLLDEHIGELHGAMSAAGLQIGEIECLAGYPPTPTAASTQPPLIRDKA